MIERWRRLPPSSGPSDRHFALSDALVRLAPQPSLWWHRADRPWLILGATQGLADVNLEACRAAGIQVVQRHAGGSAVFATPDVLGLDVCLPPDHPLVAGDIVRAYRWLGMVWQHALSGLGVPAALVTIDEARASRPALAAACFGGLSPFEVTVSGRKLVGLAQVRRSAGVLLQAGIHLRFDAATLARLVQAEDSAAQLAEAAAGLDEIAPDVTIPALVEGVERSLTALHEVRLVPGAWTPREWQHALVTPGVHPTDAFPHSPPRDAARPHW